MRVWLKGQLVFREKGIAELTNTRIDEYHQGIDVVHPFNPKATLLSFVLLEHGLEVSGLEPENQHQSTLIGHLPRLLTLRGS